MEMSKKEVGRWLDRGLDKGEPKERTLRAQQLAERLGYKHGSYIYKFINGERALSKKQIAIAAEFIGELPPNDKRSALAPPATAGQAIVAPQAPKMYPISGIVEAGAFREQEALDGAEPRFVPLERDETYPNATPMAWEVRGDSMDKKGMVDGTIAYGVNFQEAGVPIHDGIIVVVEQNRDGLIERSIKAVAIFPDRVEFQPRSTNPLHKPIVYHNGESAKHGIEVRVLTLIRGSGIKY